MQNKQKITILGAGITGLWQAFILAKSGYKVRVLEQGSQDMKHSCSWYAGGMLAPYCELETAEEIICEIGLRSIEIWKNYNFNVIQNGSLVVTHSRDKKELERLIKASSNFEHLNRDQIIKIEPDIADSFTNALYFPKEAHLDPREIIPNFFKRLQQLKVDVKFNCKQNISEIVDNTIIDCRGLNAQIDTCPTLRGVKGEIAIIYSNEIKLSRPVRVMHPRTPIYIIPRGDGHFLIGATTIESDDHQSVSVRSIMELLSAAYTINPAFGEANIIELATHVRPAFPDNKPKIRITHKESKVIISINGLYRHGYLLSPALAEITLKYLKNKEPMSPMIEYYEI